MNKKKKTIINILYYAIILALFYCFMRYAFGLFFPFIIAFFVAMILQKPINSLSEKTHIKKSVVSTVMILLVVAVLLTLVSLLGVRIFNAFKDFGDYLIKKFGDLPNFLDKFLLWTSDRIKFLPDSIESTINKNLESFVDSFKEQLTLQSGELAAKTQEASSGGTIISSIFSKINFSTITNSLSGVWTTAKAIPAVLLATIVSIIACCFMSVDYDRIANFLKKQISRRNNALGRAKHIVLNSLGKLIKAYSLIILVTFTEMLIGLAALKLFGIYKGNWIFFIAAGTALVDILPVLGTGTILLPWAVYQFISGDIAMGIGILVLYAFITVMRQFIEPKLVAGQLGLPPFITIMGMYIGLKLFGIIGMFVVPLAIILLKLLNDEGIIHVWKTKVVEKSETGENAVEEKENQEKPKE